MPNLIDIELNSCSKYFCHLSASDENVLNLAKFGFDKNEFPFSQIYGPVSFDLMLRLIVTDTTTNDLLSKCVQVCLHTKTNTSVMSLFINLASILLWKPSI